MGSADGRGDPTLFPFFPSFFSRALLRSLLRRARCCTTPLVCALFSGLLNYGATWALVHHNAATRNAAMHNAISSHRNSYLAIDPAPHRVSRALRAREPRKSPKRVPKEYPRDRAPKVPKECAPESQKSPKRVQNLTFGLFSDSFGTPGRTLSGLLGPLPRGTLSGLFSDSSGFLGPKRPGDPVWGGVNCNSYPFLRRHRCHALPCFSASPVIIFLHRAHRLSAFASIFPFATMVYCTKQQKIYQESQCSDVATGNAGWASQTQTQTQRCGALRPGFLE